MIIYKKAAMSTMFLLIFIAFTPAQKAYTFDHLDQISTNEAETLDEKEKLRKKWQNLLGVDLFYPYFQAKEAESWISNQAKIELFELTGKPEFQRNQVTYNFKIEF